MLTQIIPKLPMRNKAITKEFYITQLGFKDISSEDYEGYLLMERDNIEIHFFEFKELTQKKIMGKFIFVPTTLKGFIKLC